MLKVYGSKDCYDCIRLKKNFDTYHIEYEFIDVLDSLKNLKAFLKLRDTLPVFDHLKAIHDIGLPAIIKEDGEVFVDYDTYLKDLGYKVLEIDNKKDRCSIHGC